MITISGIISALLFYVLPILIGRPIVRLSPLNTHNTRYPFIGYFAVGALTVYFAALIINLLTSHYPPLTTHPSPPNTFITLYTGFLIVATVFAAVGNIFAGTDDLNAHYTLPFLISLLLSVAAFVLWHVESIYPFNWDLYEHQTLVNIILEGKFSYFTSQMSDTFMFDGYSSIFHLLMASSQLFFKPEIFSYWNSLTIIHSTLLALAAYLVVYELTGKPLAGLLNMLFCVFLFDSVVSFSTLFFIPQTFTACIFAYIWLQLIAHYVPPTRLRQGYDGQSHPPLTTHLPSPIWISLFVFFILLNHYIIGFAAVAIYLTTYLYIHFRTWIHHNINMKYCIAILLLFGAILIAVSPFLDLGFLNQGEGAAYTFTFSKKYEIMRQMYGYFLALFLPISAFLIIKSKHEMYNLILILTAGILCIVAAQLPYAVKFYVLGRQFVHIVLALGMTALIAYFPLILRRIIIVSIVASLTALFILNSIFWKSNLRYHEFYAHISPYELEATTFLKNRYGNSSSLLISDPATMHILEPFAKVNTQGGAYANLNTRRRLHEVAIASETSDISRMVAALSRIHDTVETGHQTKLFAVSGRYFLWQYSNLTDKESISYNVWYPLDMTPQNKRFLLLLEQYPQYFEKVFENQAIAIFELKI